MNLLKNIIKIIDRFFTWSFSSKYNPLHHSGSLAVGLLAAVIVSGLYLIFFYSIGAPYESLQNIQSQWYLGRWVRSFHRYTSDVTAVVVAYHICLMFSAGKSWGPRTLAWLSGCVLLGALFISGWTGFVMVWDQHGQLLAQEGAKLFQVFPFLRDDMIAAFSGQREVPGSFFFMNMFLHVAIPLGMILGLWIHTSKMARIQVWPNKSIYIFLMSALVVFSIVWTAPLLDKGSLNLVINRIPIDIYFGFFVPISQNFSPLMSLIVLTIGFFFLMSIVLWTKTKKKQIKLSTAINDEHNCTGCTQCYQDCPYEAIQMVPTTANKKGIAAKPDPDLCAMCGICAASCSELNIAPPEINGSIQINEAKAFCEKFADPEGIVVIGCTGNFESEESFKVIVEKELGQVTKVYPYPTGCSGQLHTYVVKQLLEHFKGAFVWTCPTRGCENREGPEFLQHRLLGRNLPAFNVRTKHRSRVEIVNYSGFEFKKVSKQLSAYIKSEPLKDQNKLTPINLLKKVAVTALILFVIGLGTRVPVGTISPESLVRFNFLLPNLERINCKKPTAQQNIGKLAHMKSFELCEKKYLQYEVAVSLSGKKQYTENIALNMGEQGGKRVYIDHELAAGLTPVDIKIVSKDIIGDVVETYQFTEDLDVKSGEIKLINFKRGEFESNGVTGDATE